jgi:predicted dehydrogenase
MVGYAFMGAAHSHAWASAGRFFDLPLSPALTALCGRDADAVERAAGKLGWASTETDWKRLVTRDDVDLVDVCTPATRTPTSPSPRSRPASTCCARSPSPTRSPRPSTWPTRHGSPRRGVRSMVGFTYRRVPGHRPRQAARRPGPARDDPPRARAVPAGLDRRPAVPARLAAAEGQGRLGALGDIGAHVIDLAQHLLGSSISGVSGLTETFVKERPLPAQSSGLSASGSHATGPVTVDDAALFTARFASGAIGSFEATRFASGRKNAIRDRGQRLRRQPRLRLRVDERAALPRPHRARPRPPASGGSSCRRPDTPTPAAGGRPGTGSGYEHAFVARDRRPGRGHRRRAVHRRPSFDDGLQVQRVLEAVEQSAAKDSLWTPVPTSA